jgi:hypothetical protein
MKCPHLPRLRLHLPGLLPGPHSPFSFQPSVPPAGRVCAGGILLGRLAIAEQVAAQGRQMRHNSRVVHSTRDNSSKSAQILVGLITCPYSLGKSRFTIRRSRLISISNSKKRIHNPSRTIMPLQSENAFIKYRFGF